MPFETQGVSEDLLVDFTPAIKEEARRILARYRHGPLTKPEWGGEFPFVDFISTFIGENPDVDFINDKRGIP